MNRLENCTDERFDSETEKSCKNCLHEYESPDISGTTCFLCKRNTIDNRIDWWSGKDERNW